MLKTSSIFEQTIRWKVVVAVRLGHVLTQGGSERDELGESAHVSLDNELLRIFERWVIFELLTRVKQVKHAVNSILWQLLRLPILMKINQFLAENLQNLGL